MNIINLVEKRINRTYLIDNSANINNYSILYNETIYGQIYLDYKLKKKS